MKPTIKDLLKNNDDKLPAYAFPGGYPIAYIDGYNSEVCRDCAQVLLGDEYGQAPISWYIHHEGAPVFCSECNVETESAYGEPE